MEHYIHINLTDRQKSLFPGSNITNGVKKNIPDAEIPTETIVSPI